MTWAEICADRSLRELPYKIETTGRGLIMMSPAKGWHGVFQAQISHLLSRLMRGWKVISECPVQTADGVRVPDVGCMSAERFRKVKNDDAYTEAPEICVEILSPCNGPEEMALKRRLLAAKGAVEFWECDESGKVTFRAADEIVDRSRLCPEFPGRMGD